MTSTEHEGEQHLTMSLALKLRFLSIAPNSQKLITNPLFSSLDENLPQMCLR